MNMESLEDDNFEEFKGGTLEINHETSIRLSSNNSPDSNSSDLTTDLKENVLNSNLNEPSGVWRGTNLINIPKRITETLWSCKNNNNNLNASQAVANFSDVTNISNENVQDYFTFRDDVVEKAVMDCVESLINSDDDGELISTFLLTEITTWDTEKERLVILTKRAIYSVKYDFIALKKLDHKRVGLNTLDSIVIGDLVYPSSSLVPDRKTHGVRILWNCDAPLAFTQRWNPFYTDVPFITFTSHPLNRHADSLNDNQRSTFSVDEFCKQLIEAEENLKITTENNENQCLIHHKDIVLQTYVGLGSLIYNRNALGFFKVRGKFSF